MRAAEAGPYQFDPLLKREQVLETTPPPDVTVRADIVLPGNWLSELAQLCEDSSGTLFDKHAGAGSSYTHKQDLLGLLKLAYHYLKGQLVGQTAAPSGSEKALAADKLREEINECTPGFHDRVAFVIRSLSNPRTLSELLYKVREDLVLRASRAATDEVHADNRFFCVARADGLGVLPINAEDIYRGALTDDAIRRGLVDTFQKHYTALNIPFLMCDFVRSLLAECDYRDRLSGDSYTEILELKLKDCLTGVLGSGLNRHDILVIDEDTDAILDVNWGFIVRQLYARLLCDYYTEAPEVNPETSTLKDYLQYMTLNPEWREDCLNAAADRITRLIKEEVAVLKSEIQAIKDDPECLTVIEHWKKKLTAEERESLVSSVEKSLRGAGQKLFPESSVRKGSYSDKVDKKKRMKLFSVFAQCIELSQYLDSPELNKLITYYIINKCSSEGSMTPLMMAAKYGEASVKVLSSFMERCPNIFDEVLIAHLYKGVDSRGWNAAMVAVGDGAFGFNALCFLLEFMKKNPRVFTSEVLRDIFSQCDVCKSNILILIVTRRKPGMLRLFLEFIEENLDILGKELVCSLFMQVNMEPTHALLLATRHSPENLELLLAFMQRHSDIFDAAKLMKLLLQSRRWVNSILELMINSTLRDMTFPIWDKFISQQEMLFTEENLYKLFDCFQEDRYFCDFPGLEQTLMAVFLCENLEWSDRLVSVIVELVPGGRSPVRDVFLKAAEKVEQPDDKKAFLERAVSPTHPLGKYFQEQSLGEWLGATLWKTKPSQGPLQRSIQDVIDAVDEGVRVAPTQISAAGTA